MTSGLAARINFLRNLAPLCALLVYYKSTCSGTNRLYIPFKTNRLRAEAREELEIEVGTAALSAHGSEHCGIQTRVHVEAVAKDFQEQVEDLHSQIAHELETLDGMRKYQRENCVPSSVCQHFEQCIKETEVDIQKMLKQNEFLEQSIEELEEELKTILSQYGMTEKDTRRLWNKVNLSKVLEYGRSLQGDNVENLE